MFGYVKPYKPELKIRELDEYNAVYCGLCHQLGRKFSFVARFTLSYDFAFFAMLLMSLDNDFCPEYEKCKCIAHPVKNKNCCCECDALSFSAGTSAILTYYKLLDDLKDHGLKHKLRAFILLPFAKSWRKKAIVSEKIAAIDSAAKKMMDDQKDVEDQRCADSDMAASPTAEFLSTVLKLGSSSGDSRTLERIGYLIGRFIYLCDAMDDIDDDRRKGNYNPFICLDNNSLKEAKDALFLTTAELCDDFELLDLGAFKGIILNIINLGLRNEVLRIENKGGCNSGTKSV